MVASGQQTLLRRAHLRQYRYFEETMQTLIRPQYSLGDLLNYVGACLMHHRPSNFVSSVKPHCTTSRREST